MRPKAGLVGGGREREFLPEGIGGEPGGEAAHGGEPGEVLVEEVGGDFPWRQLQGEGLGEIEGGVGEGLASVAGEGEVEVAKS